VANVMLGTGSNVERRIELALVSANIGLGELGGEEWIFSFAFGNASPTRIAGNVDHGRERPANPVGRGLMGGKVGSLLYKRGVPRCGERERDGKCGAIAVNDVESENERNVQARFLHR